MNPKYKVGYNAIAFKGYKVGDSIQAEFYQGVIREIVTNTADDKPWYRLGYRDENGKKQFVMVFEDEIDFVRKTYSKWNT